MRVIYLIRLIFSIVMPRKRHVSRNDKRRTEGLTTPKVMPRKRHESRNPRNSVLIQQKDRHASQTAGNRI